MTASPRHRIGAYTTVVLLALAGAVPPAVAGQIEDKRAEAAAIASRLEAQAQRIVAQDIEHRRAVRELESAEANVAQAQAELAATSRRHDEAKRRLVVQAQDAYVVGGSVSVLQYLVRSNTGDQVARRTYLRIMTGQDRAALGLLRATREDQHDMQKRLDQARQAARAKAKASAEDKAELDKFMQTQRSLLAEVNGDLAQLIAAEQAARDARDAEAARVAAARLVAASATSPPRALTGSVTPAAAVAAVPANAPPAPAPMSNADTWSCIRQLESGNNYATPGGGAYQFLDSTWQSLGYTGTASDAPPAVQDEAAMKLQARSGWSQWTTAPLCGRP